MKGKDDVNSSTCTLYPGSDRDHYTTYLQQYTNCLNNSTLNTLSVFVSSQLEPTAISETNQLISKLRSIVKNPQCLLNLEPLICLQFINLCGAEMNMGPIVPSKAQCDHALSVCGDQVLAKLIPILHLDVGKYNNVAYCAPESPLDNLTCNITTDVSTNSQQTVNCSEDFFYSDKRKGCIPECDGWTPFSSRVVLITDILTVFPAVVGVVAGVAVLLTSWARCRKL